MNVFLTSPGRSGTHWLGFLLRSLFGLKKMNVKYKFEDRDYLIEELLTSNFDNSIVIKHIPLGDLKDISLRMNIICIYRDPRDALVSAAHYLINNYSEECLNNWGESIYKPESIKESIELYIKHGYHNEWYISYINNRALVNNFSIKYEDLVCNTKKILESISGFLDIHVSDSDLNKAITTHSFERLSKGRKVGVEDISSHFRKGIIGDWRNVLTKDQNIEFINRHGYILKGLCYGL